MDAIHWRILYRGLICDRITNISGSSDYFEGGMVTYSNESKAEYLGVPFNDIKRYGAVSPQVAKKMAQGVRKAFHTTFGIIHDRCGRADRRNEEEPYRENFHWIG